jgi:hypothetical protein
LDTRIDAPLGGGLTLIGHSLPLKHVRVGEAYPLTLGWRIDAGWSGANDVCFEARRAARRAELGCQALPSSWQAGDVWRVPYRVRLSPALDGGEHELVLRVGANERMLGTVNIDTPPRVLAQPPVQTEQRAEFGDAGTLIGYSAPLSATMGTRLPVTLLWRGTRETERKYTVFVHLIDAAGQRRAGHDGEPDGGAQLTSTWLSGAYVSDRHELELPPDLPPGVYRLAVGLYDTFTGVRLPLADGAAQVLLRGEVVIARAAP